jgi:hypothetical protein
MIDWDRVTDYVGIGGMVGGILWAAFRGRGWLKRWNAQDSSVIADGAAHVDMLKRAMNEADAQRRRADNAFDQRNQAVSELGALRAQVLALEQHRINCERRIAELEQEVRYLRSVVDRRMTPRE